ncbi:MAG: hypothetical protein HONBIEJF_02379 [Fimbriimonadaceae bacterium]|nr:hypothetical protein [Fimbriimonadaceae bacterium]
MATASWEGPFFWNDNSVTPGDPPSSGDLANLDKCYIPVHMSHVYDGTKPYLLVWQYGSGSEGHQTPEARLWDINARTWDSNVPFSYANLFCTGTCQLNDGSLACAGGHIDNGYGADEMIIFNPVAKTWTRKAVGRRGRWYPTAIEVRVNEGGTWKYKVFVHAGTVVATGDMDVDNVRIPQLNTFPSNSWTPPRDTETGVLDEDPNVRHYYPHLYIMPDGRIFKAGTEYQTQYYDIADNAWEGSATFLTSDTDYASGAMYEPGKIMRCGGRSPAIATTGRFDHSTGVWNSTTSSMAETRRLHNCVILPDGRVLAIGGNRIDLYEEPRFTPEIWDPATNSWSSQPQPGRLIPRWYHATAQLLPDGKVIVAGGDSDTEFNAKGNQTPLYQIFKPAYLNTTAIPNQIATAPSTLQVGSGNFNVLLTRTSPITKACLIRLGSTTHGFDASQRYVPLSIVSQTLTALVLTAPSDQYVAPPGNYMLFVMIDEDGEKVPSTAKYVKVTPS